MTCWLVKPQNCGSHQRREVVVKLFNFQKNVVGKLVILCTDGWFSRWKISLIGRFCIGWFLLLGELTCFPKICNCNFKANFVLQVRTVLKKYCETQRTQRAIKRRAKNLPRNHQHKCKVQNIVIPKRSPAGKTMS